MTKFPGNLSEIAPLLNSSSTKPSSACDEKKSASEAILQLAIPAAAALLVDPLMTLTDTAMVGYYSTDGANPLAGMGSAAALLTLCFYASNFLCTATTPLVARYRAAGEKAQANAVGGQALSLSLILGTILAVLLKVFQQPLLQVMGTGVTGEAANRYAFQFLSVRALASPAILCIVASTGVLRGYLDTRTPIIILIATNLLNLTLDVILIALWGQGPLGAAVATTTAEWTASILFLCVLSGRISMPFAATSGSSERLNVVPLLSIPPWQEMRPLILASSSVFSRTIVLQCFFAGAAIMAARGHVVSGSTAAAAVAAHQIGIQLWLLCSFFCDSLAAASQGLIADALGRSDGRDVVKISKAIFMYSLILGLLLAAILQVGTSTGWLFELFTHNDDTRSYLESLLPVIVLAQPMNALVFAADGVLQGASEFRFQAKSMALSGGAGVASFVALEHTMTDVNTLVHIWMALLVLQAMRGITSLWKLVDPQGPIKLTSTEILSIN